MMAGTAEGLDPAHAQVHRGGQVRHRDRLAVVGAQPLTDPGGPLRAGHGLVPAPARTCPARPGNGAGVTQPGSRAGSG